MASVQIFIYANEPAHRGDRESHGRGYLHDVIQVDITRLASGKFDASSQNAMDRLLSNLEAGRFSHIQKTPE
tara:strand:- start:61 stop:276 length:216 start_codon:yes stop_codon:yes gene_type:complete